MDKRNVIYYYPPASKGGYTNNYSLNYKKALEQYFNVLDKENKPSIALGISFLFNAFRADIYIINWLESIVFLRFGFLQFILAQLGLWIIKFRKKKIIWMFHNIHPHQGENVLSQRIQNILYESADWVISHSQEAAEYAKKKAKGEVLYVCHPVKPLDISPLRANIFSDVLIWGAILPYKGINEFLQEAKKRNIDLSIHIIGKCSDPILTESIQNQCGKHFIFENRHVPFDELAGLIQHTKYVLFPYIGDCVSSSGALIDTITLGGCPIGPNKGAFKDLAQEGVCITYQNYSELFSILKKPSCLNKSHIEKFINENSWNAFADLVYKKCLLNRKANQLEC